MQNQKDIIPIRSDFPEIVPGIQLVNEFAQFVLWFATPRQFRELETQKEFAGSIRVCEDTLTDWKRHPSFWPLVLQAMNGWIKEHVPDVIGGLYFKATSDKASSKDV
ncbi:MAG: hypothetical protein NT116_05565, partial [Candidatus Parcubacteria bacterium]|nr:hypothetical protein [Candidatus Parcubacteria bacterium]